jgi:hypothetical protein
VSFDRVDTATVEIYFHGELHGGAPLVNPTVNAQIASPKPVTPAAPEPTGINFVELLEKKNNDDKE